MANSNCTVSLSAAPLPPALVGGKAVSLMRLHQAGFQVPAGFVLTTEFADPWFDELKKSETYHAFVKSPSEQPCLALQANASKLGLSGDQRAIIDTLRTQLKTDTLFAVRSSSPDEDLTSASFAGGYETCLGVPKQDLETAIHHCLISCLDYRVVAYKEQQGFDLMSPRLAIIIQEQIHSDVAGVAFSINPANNDYDEVAISANWGQGDSVVAGLVSPDHFVVDKVDSKILEKHLGKKQISKWIEPSGGIQSQAFHRSGEYTLNDDQIVELTRLTKHIEQLYELPVDVEWAVHHGTFYLLQARPITAYVPLPPELITEPGQRRNLYGDAALSSGFTLNAPISPIGISFMQAWTSDLVNAFIGKLKMKLKAEDSLWICAGNRMYMNLSAMLRIQSQKSMAASAALSDSLMAETILGLDASRYRSLSKPPWSSWRMLPYLPRFIWRVRVILWRVVIAFVTPKRAHRRFIRQVQDFERRLLENTDYHLSPNEFRRTVFDRGVLGFKGGIRHLFAVAMAPLGAGLLALSLINLIVGRKNRDAAKALRIGFHGNPVVEMGIAMAELAARLNPSDIQDQDALEQRISNRSLAPEFMQAWDDFMARYGRRGPLEMDLATPRYADRPSLLLRQIASMPINDEAFDPKAMQQRQIDARELAFESIMKRSSWPRRLLLKRLHTIIGYFAGARDVPKHMMLLAFHALRKRLLMEGKKLREAGRLDKPEHIFELTFDDLDDAVSNDFLDLRSLGLQRTAFMKRLKAVRNFPLVIDSRGRILRPHKKDGKPGELSGMAVSPGVFIGPVKVLHHPDEKTIEKGDVLVAYTTDPGWTPLFANAGAILLEVGGILQHGAVVAREYGKPCVAGIDGIVTLLKDGQMVQVDGSSGTVQILEK